MSKSIVEHAEYELKKAGLVDNPNPEARKVATDALALVRRFEKQQHTENTAQWVAQFFTDLISFIPLTPITDDPEEWEKFEIEQTNKDTKEKTTVVRWQSRRCPSIFSEDEGKTWFDQATGQNGKTVSAEEERKRIQAIRDAEQKKLDEAEKAKAAPAEAEAKEETAAEAPAPEQESK